MGRSSGIRGAGCDRVVRRCYQHCWGGNRVFVRVDSVTDKTISRPASQGSLFEKTAIDRVFHKLASTGRSEIFSCLSFLDCEEFIGAKKHLVLSLRSQTGPLGSNSFAIA